MVRSPTALAPTFTLNTKRRNDFMTSETYIDGEAETILSTQSKAELYDTYEAQIRGQYGFGSPLLWDIGTRNFRGFLAQQLDPSLVTEIQDLRRKLTQRELEYNARLGVEHVRTVEAERKNARLLAEVARLSSPTV